MGSEIVTATELRARLVEKAAFWTGEETCTRDRADYNYPLDTPSPSNSPF